MHLCYGYRETKGRGERETDRVCMHVLVIGVCCAVLCAVTLLPIEMTLNVGSGAQS